MSEQLYWWVGFNLFVLAMLALDLGVFHRHAHTVRFREALGWSVFWIALALTFNVVIYVTRGRGPAVAYFTGYLLEKSLSVDNIFVFLLIFKYFRVPAQYQHRVLFWGILGALIMRAMFIAAGVALIHRFHWVIYIFGAFLVFTGIKMALGKGQEVHPERNPALRLARRLLRVTGEYEEGHFFVRRDGLRFATPLFIVLVFVETTDVVFALDSIPAILGITHDPFIVYTSNVFAILGLRALYFAIVGVLELFHYLHYGLSAVLVFIGVKMLISGIYEIQVEAALAVVAVILLISVAASMIWPEKPKADAEPASPVD